MKLLLVLLSLLTFNNAPETYSDRISEETTLWGQTGHRVIGLIAEGHLTRKASRKIEKLLEGKSLAFVSTYADEIKSDRAYSKYGPWHYVNFALGTNYDVSNRDDAGDIIFGIEQWQRRCGSTPNTTSPWSRTTTRACSSTPTRTGA